MTNLDRQTLNDIWQAVMGELEVELSQANFNTWFKDTYLAELTDTKATLVVPHKFGVDWIKGKYNGEIIIALKKHKPKVCELEYKISAVKPQEILPIFSQKTARRTGDVPIRKEYRFDTFVVGNSNKLAFASAKAVAESLDRKGYNPLFVYGGVGLGKTHLAQAIANYLLENSPKVKIIYVSCEKFTNDFIGAVQNGKMEYFKKQYREIDILIVDDIQFLSNKEGSQQEFFHTFNTLHQTNRQIVITADRTPRQIPALEDRLTSRLGWGMIADIQPPNLETRLAILKSKSAEHNLEIEDNVFEYIAHSIQSNIRDLEGALNRIASHCELYGLKPTLDNCQQILKDIITQTTNKNISLVKLFKTVSEFYGATKADLISPKRNQELILPRQILMYLMRHELNFSFSRIAAEIGGKDHTTIMHGCKKIEKNIAKEDELKNEMVLLKERLYSI